MLTKKSRRDNEFRRNLGPDSSRYDPLLSGLDGDPGHPISYGCTADAQASPDVCLVRDWLDSLIGPTGEREVRP